MGALWQVFFIIRSNLQLFGCIDLSEAELICLWHLAHLWPPNKDPKFNETHVARCGTLWYLLYKHYVSLYTYLHLNAQCFMFLYLNRFFQTVTFWWKTQVPAATSASNFFRPWWPWPWRGEWVGRPLISGECLGNRRGNRTFFPSFVWNVCFE